jgi:hypothetical protein
MSAQITRLLQPGLVGHFTTYEAVEIFAIPPDGHSTNSINLLTVVVTEEVDDDVDGEAQFLNRERIRLSSLKGWTFGVQRYRRPISSLQRSLDDLVAHQEWRPSGSPSRTGPLTELPAIFVPPDATDEVPLNKLLKNNFWNGSHVFEWGDPDKAATRVLTDDPRRLAELGEKLQEVIPISLASLSDRIGHVIVQIPVTVLMARFGKSSRGLTVDVAWSFKASPRPLLASSQMEFDKAITGAMAVSLLDGSAVGTPAGRGQQRSFLWDSENGLLMAASAPTSYIRSIGNTMRVGDPEPRTFELLEPNGLQMSERIGLTQIVTHNLVGEKYGDDIGGWTIQRIYHQEAARLAQERQFKVYPSTSDPLAAHKEALKDLRILLARHGEEGVWLWDPYLSAQDIIETLFHCPFSGTPLRALSAGKSSELRHADFVTAQRTTFSSLTGNLRGLKLEYRMRSGTAGWPFHDRFLIFPRQDGGALAWSLGTSINSFGKEHHILQKVDNGALIANAFQDLWELLAAPENLVWRRP